MPQCVVFHYDSLEMERETTSVILAARRNICTIAALATTALVQINITKVVDLLSLDIMIISYAIDNFSNIYYCNHLFQELIKNLIKRLMVFSCFLILEKL